MISKILLISLLLMALTSRAQETLLPDSTLHLPSLNNLGQMHYINRWPYYDPMEFGDRFGAALKYNFSPSTYIQISVEKGRATRDY